MRAFLAIVQLLLLSLPTFASLTTLTGRNEAKLPICCRKSGAHHCMLSAAERSALAGLAQSEGIAVTATPQPCPYCPKALPTAQHAPASLVPSAMIFAQIVSHPASPAQTLAKFRISRDRSRQKRGPPELA